MKRLIARILVSAVLVSVVVWTGLMATSSQFGKRAFAAQEMDSSARHYSTFLRTTPAFWEGWEGPFSRGTARLGVGIGDGGVSVAGEQYTNVEDAAAVARGVSDLEVALERVPEAKEKDKDTDGPECTVRRNLSLGYELQGDAVVSEAAGTGDAAEQAAAGEAAPLYAQAQEAIAPCTDSPDNQEQSDRQQQKQQEQEDQGAPQDDPQQDPDPDPDSGDPETQQQEEQLNERNDEGKEQYEDGQQGTGMSDGVNW